MRIFCVCMVSAFCSLLYAQDRSDLFEKAPPAIDDALRARITAFYQAHVDGKFRVADTFVAEDAKDAFFEADKERYKSCRISKISYAENFTKAEVITACQIDFLFAARRMVVPKPMLSHWKIVNGDWFWYTIPETERETPWGKMRVEDQAGKDAIPAADPQASLPPIDPQALARDILTQVKVEPTAVSVVQGRSSRQTIHVRNGMPGPIAISVDATGFAGLTIKPVKPQLAEGEETDLIVDYNFQDPTISCADCRAHASLAPFTVALHIDPTGQKVPIQVTMVPDAQRKN